MLSRQRNGCWRLLPTPRKFSLFLVLPFALSFSPYRRYCQAVCIRGTTRAQTCIYTQMKAKWIFCSVWERMVITFWCEVKSKSAWMPKEIKTLCHIFIIFYLTQTCFQISTWRIVFYIKKGRRALPSKKSLFNFTPFYEPLEKWFDTYNVGLNI